MLNGVMKDNYAIVSCLELRDVSYSYGNVPVIKGLNVVVKPGEFVVLIGPSGCGKTTLLNLLSGHVNPVSGKILKRGIIRTVYQSDSLFPWLTVSENIKMGLGALNLAQKKQDLKELIELIHLQGFENYFPHQLSGGMRQRVELARVLAGDSDILLMDEPFSALDYQTRIRIRRELVDLLAKRARTVVFVTHDIEEAVQLADRVLVLSHRPTFVSRELHIKASKPRDLTHPAVIKAMKEILFELGLQTSFYPDARKAGDSNGWKALDENHQTRWTDNHHFNS
jgi:NitT/TauT family transport system ATP-binding protein